MNDQTRWSDLLKAAVTEPGLIMKAYSAFHGYSLGNQVAAMIQCQMRSIEPGPINTYPGWQKLNRQVRKGEKALWLCMPLTRKVKQEDRGEHERVITNFIWKPLWFVLSQTDGEPIEMPEMLSWNKDKALSSLNIIEAPFTHSDGNCQGFARKREIAISPIAAMPHKTLFHEIGHVELGHTAESDFNDSEITPRSLKEVEAEATAMLLLETLGLEGSEYCRGYIQNWLQRDSIPKKSAMRVFGAADRILRAGQVE